MKYYYNGNLVRTSKNEYHFGLLRNGVCIKCSKTRKGCESEITSEVNFSKRQIAYLEKNLNKDVHNKEYLEDHLNFVNNTKWEIVELEVM